MQIYALSDPHLSFNRAGEEYKPMHIFGDSWEHHGEKIRRHWLNCVQEDDVVLLPGDISWAMNLEELQPDLEFLAALPGKKILSKGNHDLWWESVTKIKKYLPENFFVLHNNSYVFDDVAVCGTRGWPCPEKNFATAQDEKIFQRELGRLERSLASVPPEVPHKIAMFHYPPINVLHEKSAFVSLMEQYHVTICLYGHLHSYAIQTALEGEHWGIQFQLVSADYLKFQPKAIWPVL